MMFSPNASQSTKKNLWLQALGLGVESTEVKYLGLLTYIGRSWTIAYFKDNIWKKLQGWKEHLMSWLQRRY
jgi:hypothetical protein